MSFLSVHTKCPTYSTHVENFGIKLEFRARLVVWNDDDDDEKIDPHSVILESKQIGNQIELRRSL